MDAVRSIETLGNIFQTVRRRVLVHTNLCSHRYVTASLTATAAVNNNGMIFVQGFVEMCAQVAWEGHTHTHFDIAQQPKRKEHSRVVSSPSVFRIRNELLRFLLEVTALVFAWHDRTITISFSKDSRNREHNLDA